MSTIYKALSSTKFLKRLNEIEKIIKFSSLPKDGVDQCDGQEDPTGILNFKKAFGEEMSEGIDFNKNNFIFSRMRKCCLSNSSLQIIAKPRAPDVFQDNLTKYLSTLEKNTIVVSDYKIQNEGVIEEYGGRISYICGSSGLNSFRFEIDFTKNNNSLLCNFYEKKDSSAEAFAESLAFNGVDQAEKNIFMNDCTHKTIAMVLDQSKIIAKMKDIELILRHSFFRYGTVL